MSLLEPAQSSRAFARIRLRCNARLAGVAVAWLVVLSSGSSCGGVATAPGGVKVDE